MFSPSSTTTAAHSSNVCFNQGPSPDAQSRRPEQESHGRPNAAHDNTRNSLPVLSRSWSWVVRSWAVRQSRSVLNLVVGIGKSRGAAHPRPSEDPSTSNSVSQVSPSDFATSCAVPSDTPPNSRSRSSRDTIRVRQARSEGSLSSRRTSIQSLPGGHPTGHTPPAQKMSVVLAQILQRTPRISIDTRSTQGLSLSLAQPSFVPASSLRQVLSILSSLPAAPSLNQSPTLVNQSNRPSVYDTRGPSLPQVTSQTLGLFNTNSISVTVHVQVPAGVIPP